MLERSKNNRLDLKLLVVGTGCCGTVFLAKFLTSVGISCTHEAIFTPAGIQHALNCLRKCDSFSNSEISLKNGDWLSPEAPIQAESSYLAAPYLQHQEFASLPLIHLVRNPLHVIESFVYDSQYFLTQNKSEACTPWEVFIRDKIPEISVQPNALSRALLYYLRWNELIERAYSKRRVLRHRIEDPVDNIFEFLTIDKPEDYFKNRKANTKRRDFRKLSLSDFNSNILKEELIAIAQRYGYNLEQGAAEPHWFL